MGKLELEYLYPHTASRYDFYLMPKLLLDHEAFDSIDHGTKLLYILMLNQTASEENYIDDNGIPYIIYTVEQVMKRLRCGNKNAIKMLKQLEDIGLIERKRQGLGNPSVTYVNDISKVVM